MSARPTPAVRVVDLSYSYPGGHSALDSISLDIAPGERVAVLGPNGAGKSTLMLQLNGVLTATSGEVHIGGTLLQRSTVRTIRERVGLVFQDPDDQLFMPTVAQDVAFGPANFGVRGDELTRRVAEALEAVDMADRADRSPPQLSLGSAVVRRWRRYWRAAPRCWCSTSRPPTSIHSPGVSSPTFCAP